MTSYKVSRVFALSTAIQVWKVFLVKPKLRIFQRILFFSDIESVVIHVE